MVGGTEGERAGQELVDRSLWLLFLPSLQVRPEMMPTDLQAHRADARLQLLVLRPHDPLDRLVGPVQESVKDGKREFAEGLSDGVDVVLVEVGRGKAEESLSEDDILRHAVVPVLTGKQLSVLAVLLQLDARHVHEVSMFVEVRSDPVEKNVDGPVILEDRTRARVGVVGKIEEERSPCEDGYQEPSHLFDLCVGDAMAASYNQEPLGRALVLLVQDPSVQVLVLL
mmetsp:Transcript_6648/g.15255  ORF Transcript_6648/g.15255 Transcript_6648/m.15255 type:complete len:226 (+) Transcript_6648:932-1609(+)